MNPSFESLDICALLGVAIKRRRLVRGHGGVGNFNSRGIECRWYKRVKNNNGLGRVKLGEGMEGQSREAHMGKSN